MINENRLSDILSALEMSLSIDYSYGTTNEIINASVHNLEVQHHISLDKKIADCLVENILAETGARNLLCGVTENLKNFALYLTTSMFVKKYPSTLYDVNYLGFAKQELLCALKCMQAETIYYKSEEFLDELKRATDFIEMSDIKRLLIISYILDRIGMQEGTAMIANYLYLGGM